MKQLSILLVAGCFTLTAFGQDMLQCVNPDVVNSLVFGGRAESRMSLSATLPDSMSDYRAPAGFELIGTGVRGEGVTTIVAFKTELASEHAFAALVDSVEAEGWELEEEQSSLQTFNVSSQPVRGMVCRDAKRRMLSVQDVAGMRYATLSTNQDQRSYACHAEDPRMAMGGPAMFGAMRSLMPKLDFPETTRPADGQGGFGGGMSGSGDTISTSSRIVSPDTAASLAEHLALQMTAQGWRRDAAWNGSLTSGSTWMLQGEDGPSWGTLEIVGFGDDVYEVGFMLMQPPL
jgi:hypothetical protein